MAAVYFACQAGAPMQTQAADAPASLDHILESMLQLLKKKGHNIHCKLEMPSCVFLQRVEA